MSAIPNPAADRERELRAVMDPLVTVLMAQHVTLRAARAQLAGRMVGLALIASDYHRERAGELLGITGKSVTELRRELLRAPVAPTAAAALARLAELMHARGMGHRAAVRTLRHMMLNKALGGKLTRYGAKQEAARALGVTRDTVRNQVRKMQALGEVSEVPF